MALVVVRLVAVKPGDELGEHARVAGARSVDDLPAAARLVALVEVLRNKGPHAQASLNRLKMLRSEFHIPMVHLDVAGIVPVAPTSQEVTREFLPGYNTLRCELPGSMEIEPRSQAPSFLHGLSRHGRQVDFLIDGPIAATDRVDQDDDRQSESECPHRHPDSQPLSTPHASRPNSGCPGSSSVGIRIHHPK